MKHLLTLCVLLCCASAFGQADGVKEKYLFKTTPEPWRGERISLPPGFAPAMTLKGVEDIRFAPGMFDAAKEDFFTYVLILSIPEKPVLTDEMLRREFLAYYQGLGEQVGKGRGLNLDGKKFTLKLKKAKVADVPKKAQKVKAFTGELDWVEPFRTGKKQTLHLELHTWSYPDSKRQYVFACISPKKRDHALWKGLRKTRETFVVEYVK